MSQSTVGIVGRFGLAAVGLLVVGGLAAGCAVEDTTAAPAPEVSVTATASSPEKKAEPEKGTKTQQQALRAAEDYLDMLAFSKKGLQQQLEYDKHTKADAQWAVEHVDADWMEQAVKAAQSYLDVMSFSEEGLVDQLVNDGFTKEQATHGAAEAMKD